MSATSNIEWTDKTWNPIRGCSRVSPGCERCYAERQAARFAGFYGDGGAGPYAGLIKVHVKERILRRDLANGEVQLRKVEMREPRWTGELRFVPNALSEPMGWKKPAKVFVNSMSDLFHEKLSNEEIAAVFGVMAAAKRHTFQVLTKRPQRMVEWFNWVAKTFAGRYEGPALASHAASHFERRADSATGNLLWRAANEAAGRPWPLPNVHIGVSVEDQKRADERIPLLLQTPAALRFLSVEPLLEPVNIRVHIMSSPHPADCVCGRGHGFTRCPNYGSVSKSIDPRRSPSCSGFKRVPGEGIEWVIVGGESGPGARPCDIAWIRSVVQQCKDTGTPAFVKQLGSNSVAGSSPSGIGQRVKLEHSKGADMAEWSDDLRVREMPGGAR